LPSLRQNADITSARDCNSDRLALCRERPLRAVGTKRMDVAYEIFVCSGEWEPTE